MLRSQLLHDLIDSPRGHALPLVIGEAGAHVTHGLKLHHHALELPDLILVSIPTSAGLPSSFPFYLITIARLSACQVRFVVLIVIIVVVIPTRSPDRAP